MAQSQHRTPHEEPSDDLLDGKMGFLEHLDELRTRLIRSCVAIAVAMIVAFLFVGRIADFVLDPVLNILAPGASLIMTRPGEGLSFYLDVALIGGIVLAAPFVTYQLWRFIAPGLYTREKRLVVPFFLLATVGTVAGAAFSHYVLFPSMMAFFSTFDSPRMRFMPRVEETFALYRNMLISMVAVFQIPTLVFFLARMRLITPRFLWRQIKYAVFLIFLVAAILTPSADPWNQALFAAPMIVLYMISIVIAWLVEPREKQTDPPNRLAERHLKVVFAAAVLDQARRRNDRVSCEFPRPCLK